MGGDEVYIGRQILYNEDGFFMPGKASLMPIMRDFGFQGGDSNQKSLTSVLHLEALSSALQVYQGNPLPSWTL